VKRSKVKVTWGEEVKVQGHVGPRIDLEVWQRHRSAPLGSSWFFCSFL